MRSEHTVEVSRSNFDSAIESFLRATDVIHDSETPQTMRYTFSKTNDTVSIGIIFKQEVKTDQTTIH